MRENFFYLKEKKANTFFEGGTSEIKIRYESCMLIKGKIQGKNYYLHHLLNNPQTWILRRAYYLNLHTYEEAKV